MEAVRNSNGYIAYLDETWCYPGMRPNYGWVDVRAQENPFNAMKDGIKVTI